MAKSVFEEFIGEKVKAPYKDGTQFKIARGVLISAENGFVKIKGKLGTIIINEKNIEKMSRISESERNSE
ncbi:MAG: hypothetical protein PHV16_03410 [Candidatus Nanoarchaeia archaeon]|nr:hypothetical protein [Candidatus Nanoarchaeia archaeon]